MTATPSDLTADDRRLGGAQPGLGAPDAGAGWPPAPTPEQQRAWQQTTPGQDGQYGQPPAPGASALPTAQSVSTLAAWALVLGIVSIFINPLAGVSVAALVCGAIAFTRREQLVRAGVAVTGQGMIIAGLVCGAIGLACTAVFKVFLF